MEKTQIQRVLDYIEAHLTDDSRGVLDTETLAKAAGYSEYHFIRLFRKITRFTPADYIRKRRISEIVKRIGEGDGAMSDIAFRYGFNSKENFTRAFKAEHHILPSEFRVANCSLRLFEAFQVAGDEPNPAVSLRHLPRFTIVAYPSDEPLPPYFWNKYNAEQRSLRLSGGVQTEDYGAMRWNGEEKRLDYYIGIRAEEAKGDLSGTVPITVAEGLYAVFDTEPATQHDFVSTIRRTWDWIYGRWLPESGYVRGDGFELETYTEASRTYTETILIPIKKEQI